ncbi:MAG: cyclophilin-like fold protein [Gammaproteobacteria bacterium]|nr:cyclophilin-like fold protein [Gammaproteobacteria bacterium]
MRQIKISFQNTEIIVQLRDTPTADAIYAALPIESITRTWGKEVYFETSVKVPLEPDAKDVVEAGEIAFWTEGQCIAIGFGPTPISKTSEIRLAAMTNIWADSVTPVKNLDVVEANEQVLITTID